MENTNENAETKKVIEVDLPKEDPSSISTEEILSKKEAEDKEKEQLEHINTEQKEYLVKRAKETEIDWDSIEYEEDGITPKITPEDINVFTALVSDFIDEQSIRFYLDQAKETIESYKQMKPIAESEESDKADMEYYKSLALSFEDAKIVLAMLQTESRRLAKEFNDSRIAEDFIKNISLKTLRDFIVEKFRFNDSWCSEEKTDNSKAIDDALLSKMYITTLFRQMVNRYSCKSKHSQKFNIFGHSYSEASHDTFIKAVQGYINSLPQHENIDTKTVIVRDFKAMDFVNAVILFTMVYHNDMIVSKLVLGDDEKKMLCTKLNPNECFTNQESSRLYEKIHRGINNLIDKIIKTENLEKLLEISKDIVKRDPEHKRICKDGIDMDDYASYIQAIANSFETIEGIRIMKWGKVYSYMDKYEIYITYAKLYEVISDPSKTELEKRIAGFNTIKSILGNMFMCMYGEFIDSLRLYIKNNVYSREPRNLIFANVLKNAIMQHELGFKADFIPNENSTGEQLYEIAKKVFGKDYSYMIGTESEDILLKNVDLTNVREDYIACVLDMLNLVSENMDKVLDGSYTEYYNTYEKYATNTPKKSKKPRSKRK